MLLPLNLTWLLQANERMGPAAFAEVVSQVLMLPALFLFIHNPTHVVRYVLLVYPFRIGVIGIWPGTRAADIYCSGKMCGRHYGDQERC